MEKKIKRFYEFKIVCKATETVYNINQAFDQASANNGGSRNSALKVMNIVDALLRLRAAIKEPLMKQTNAKI